MLQPSRRLLLSLLATSALAVAFAPAAHALKPVRPAKPILPVNQATRDPALVKVIAEALAAAKAKDWKRLSPHISEKIQLDFGGGAGRAEMGKRLAKRAAHWDELVWVLEHGGKFEKDGSFMAPYTFSADIGKLDPFDAGVLVAKVKAHAEPRENSAVVAELDRVAVKVTDWKNKDSTPSPFYRRTDWVQVELSGKKAWIQAKYVRSAVDFRAAFEKRRGVWLMTAFLAGD